MLIIVASLGPTQYIIDAVNLYCEHEEYSYVLEESEESSEKEKSEIEEDVEQEKIWHYAWIPSVISYKAFLQYTTEVEARHTSVFLEYVKPPPLVLKFTSTS